MPPPKAVALFPEIVELLNVKLELFEYYNICIFEVNANMNMLINKNEDNKEYLEQIEDALNTMILKAALKSAT